MYIGAELRLVPQERDMKTIGMSAALIGGFLQLSLAGCSVEPVAYAPPAGPVILIGESASQPPPPLPDYDQPPCPDPTFLWAPGYWGFEPAAGYYWVPGTWAAPPMVGVLWTPGYWGFADSVYVFHNGYWGPHVGYYGGVNYGGGYAGAGFVGARWVGNSIRYNTAVTNVNRTIIHNTYSETVTNNVTVNKASYVGGPGGNSAQPTAPELAAARDKKVAATPAQTQHAHAAAANPESFAAQNRGQPSIAATPRPGAFTAHEVTPAKPAIRPAVASSSPESARDEPKAAAAEKDRRPERTIEEEPRREDRP
jgi:WXXGXW repeat (2 copies)